MFVKVN